MQSSRYIFLSALLLTVIFAVFAQERTRRFIGHHDWDNVTWVSAAENYQRYGLWDTRLQQIRNPIPDDPEDWLVYQNHPPAISLFTLLSIEAFGNHEFTARLLPIFATIITLALFVAIVRRVHDAQIAVLSLLFFGLSPLLIYFSAKIGHEQYTLLWMMIFLYTQLIPHHIQSTLWTQVLSGVFAFVGAFVGWGWYLFVGICFLFQFYQDRFDGLKKYLPIWIGTGAGGVALLLLSLLQQPDFIQNIIDAFLLRTTNQGNAETISLQSWLLMMGSRMLWLATPVVPLLAVMFVLLRRRSADRVSFSGFAILFTSGTIFALIFWQGSFIHNYYLYYVFAPLCVWAARGFFELLYRYGRPPQRAWQLILSLIILAHLGGSYRWGTELFNHDLNEQRYLWGIEAATLTTQDEMIISNLPALGPHIAYYARRNMLYNIEEAEALAKYEANNWGIYIYCLEEADTPPAWLSDFDHRFDEESSCYFVDFNAET